MMRIPMLACWLFVGAVAVSAQQPSSTVYLADGVFDPTTKSIRRGTGVLVTGARIAGLADSTSLRGTRGARIVRLPGTVLVAGLFNAHAHFTHFADERRMHHLLYGVTSTCNMGTGLNRIADLRRATTMDGLPAARGWTAGSFIAKSGGYPEAAWGAGAAINVTDSLEAAAAVRALADSGVQFIKVSLEPGRGTWPMLTDAELRQIVRTAHARSLRVVAHVQDGSQFPRAVDAGVDVITHVPDRGIMAPDSVSLAPRLLQALDRFAKRGGVLLPTLDVLTRYFPPDDPRRGRMVAIVRAFVSLGGKVAIGNDYPLSDIAPGVPWDELDWLARAGLTAPDLLVALTWTSAVACGVEQQVGTLTPGRLADFIAVEGDPTADLATLRRPRLIVVDGTIVLERTP
jgi:imidazolonepropionase-like amidohydrolase